MQAIDCASLLYEHHTNLMCVSKVTGTGHRSLIPERGSNAESCSVRLSVNV
jgi:hypothetical protein